MAEIMPQIRTTPVRLKVRTPLGTLLYAISIACAGPLVEPPVGMLRRRSASMQVMGYPLDRGAAE